MTIGQLAQRMLVVAAAEGVKKMPQVDSLERMIKRWERGDYQPRDRYRWLLALALQTTKAELFGDDQEEENADRRTFVVGLVGAAAMMAAAQDPVVQAIERIRRLEGDLGDETLDSIEEAIRDLGLTHLRSTADTLKLQIGNLLSYVENLLATAPVGTRRRRLLCAAGWTAGLLASTHLDVGDLALARANCRAALLYGRQVGDGRLIAWARDRQAKIAFYVGDVAAVRTYVDAGLESAPKRTGVRVGLLGARARLLARLGNGEQTKLVINQIAAEYDNLPASEVGGGLFLISEIYPAASASQATVWLREPAPTIERAQEVIDFFDHATGSSRRPTRVAIAHLDIATALAQQQEVDQACHFACLAVGTERIANSVVVRADQLAARLMARWSDVGDVRDFHDRCLALNVRPSGPPQLPAGP